MVRLPGRGLAEVFIATAYATVDVPLPLGVSIVIQSTKETAVHAQPGAVLTVTVCLPPAAPIDALVGLRENVHATVVVVDVIDDVVEVLDVVGGAGGVGKGAPESFRCSVKLMKDSGLGEQVDVPGPTPAQVRLAGVRSPPNSRSAVQPDGVFAVMDPSNSPPSSTGFALPPSSPSTVPVVPLGMTKTPVILYSFSRGGSTVAPSLLAAAIGCGVINW